MATSGIDATKPADNVKADKSDLRSNFSKAKTEINKLFRFTGLPWKLADGTKTWTTL